MNSLSKRGFLLFSFLLFACSTNEKPHARVVVIQPFGDFPKTTATQVLKQLKTVNKTVLLNDPIPFPNQAFYAPRNRYRADSLIRFLKDRTGNDTVVVGLSQKDISVTKGEANDWGVMGFGYRPGKSCVVSSYRLNNKTTDQFYKVVLHELGHTEGLAHCPVKTCFMRDAEGGNHLDSETGFCEMCKRFLEDKGWGNTTPLHQCTHRSSIKE